MCLRSLTRRSFVGVSAVLACLALASCKGEEGSGGASGAGPAGKSPTSVPGGSTAAFDKPLKADGPISVQIITNGISPFWDSMGKGMDAMKAEIGCDAKWSGPNPPDNSTQKQYFENALAANVDGLAVSPIEADAFASVIDSAIDKGVPVITFDSDSPNSKRLAYIGTNNREAGKRAGEAAVKLFPNGGKLVAFVGNMSAQNARDRFEGFKEAVAGKNIEFLQDPFEDNKDAGRARQNVAEAITKHGEKINGFVGLYSYNGPAIVDEVLKSNIRPKVKIICFDGEPKTLENLGKGLVDVTVVQKPYEFGRLSTKLLYLINRKGYTAAIEEMKPELEKAGMKVDKNVIDTGVDVITPANAAPFLKKLKEMGLEST
jgi:ribose transport system substrate-binding protein